MGREEGRGFRMGNTCIPVADYVKFKNKIKFKIFKKKKIKAILICAFETEIGIASSQLNEML